MGKGEADVANLRYFVLFLINADYKEICRFGIPLQVLLTCKCICGLCLFALSMESLSNAFSTRISYNVTLWLRFSPYRLKDRTGTSSIRLQPVGISVLVEVISRFMWQDLLWVFPYSDYGLSILCSRKLLSFHFLCALAFYHTKNLDRFEDCYCINK